MEKKKKISLKNSLEKSVCLLTKKSERQMIIYSVTTNGEISTVFLWLF